MRPVIEYAAQVYHSALTTDQSNRLEALQRLALKIIYGFDVSYPSAIEMSGLELLSARRDKLCLSFAKKCSINPRYSHWFPLNPTTEYNLRNQKKFKEEFAASERRRRSPLFSMRRLLNEDEQ